MFMKNGMAMSTGAPIFGFTPEQQANFLEWKSLLNTETASQWHNKAGEAIQAIHAVLEQARFKQGQDLSAEHFNTIFRHMRELINNRALARNLYEDNGSANFNSKLRTLLYGTEPLVERVNQFLGLRRVGKLTLSQFLCALAPSEFPLDAWPTLEVLGLDAAQMEAAYRQALKDYNVSSPQSYYKEALEYLQDVVVYREIKRLLDVTFYYDINNLLWLARKPVGDEAPPFTSVGLEKDLRDYLANKPSVLESGLTLVGKEYPTQGGNVDLLCQDKRNRYVIVEMKKGRGSDVVVGQVLRYIGALKAEGKKARAIIVLNEPDKRMDFAISPIGELAKVKYYRVKFEVSDVAQQ